MLVCLALALSATALWTGEFQPVGGKIEGQYIVVFKTDLAKAARQAHLAHFAANMTLIAQHSINEFQAYSAQFTDEVLAHVEKDKSVKYVEQDGIATVTQDSCDHQTGLPAGLWGLTRVNERTLNLNGRFAYHDVTEKTVRAYILDTGIRTTHVDFDGRAVIGANFVDNVEPDQNGHGTHVASTVGGELYGVSKTSTLVAVKVLGKNGSGSWTGVIQGVEWTNTDARQYSVNSVSNMSLGGGRQQALNDAIDASSREGRVTWVIASGNSNADACNFSPASAVTALAVGATNNMDNRASFSNWGPCQGIWAPGQNVLGAWMTSDTATNTISGTSMAAPHVCGIAAAITATSREAHTPAQLIEIIKRQGTANVVIDGAFRGSNNVLGYVRCG